MSPKLVNKEEKERKLAQTALGLFAQRGFAATNVIQIAEVAGVGKGTIYEYFENKADIFVAAIREWMNQFETYIVNYLEGFDSPIEKLKAFATANMDCVDPIDPGNARLFLEFIQQSILEDGVLYKHHYLLKEIHSGQSRMVIDILLAGISKGLFRPGIASDAEKIACNLLAYIDGISLHAILSHGSFKIEEQIDMYLADLLKSILTESELEKYVGTSNSRG